MSESNAVNHFHVPKSSEEESKLLKESVHKSTVYKNKWSAKVFREWQMSHVVQVPVIDSGGVFKDWTNLHLTKSTINVEGRGLSSFFHSALLSIAKLMFLLMNESRGANNVYIVSFCSIINFD